MDKTFRNFIFDFGGVLYRIDHSRTTSAFAELAGLEDPDEIIKVSKVFYKNAVIPYEKGEFTTEDFYDKSRKILQIPNAPDSDIKDAWMQVLVEPYPDSEYLIREFASVGNLVLLSNSNELHRNHFSRECTGLFEYFDELFFSYELKLMKPDEKIFREVIERTNFDPSQTLFIDDTPENVKSAERTGLSVQLIKNHSDLSDLLHTVKPT